jgi:hypothetical protein
MLNFFKRKPEEAATPKKPVASRPVAARPRPTSSAAAGLPPVPPPLPEVREGNLESDWAMWEDSVAFQDSQMPSAFNELAAVRTRDEKPEKKSGEPDPFAAVHKRGQ